MTEFVSEREALPHARVVPVDDDYRHRFSPAKVRLGRQAVDIFQFGREQLDAALLQ